MDQLLTAVLGISLALHTVMVAIAVWRIWRGENAADRLLGVELVTTLLMAILILLSLMLESSIFIDIAIALAALGFVSTIVLAKYMADEQMY